METSPNQVSNLFFFMTFSKLACSNGPMLMGVRALALTLA